VLRVTRYAASRAPVLTILLSLPNYYVTTYWVTLGYTTTGSPSNNQDSSPDPIVITSTPNSNFGNGMSTTDVQSQMMLMLTESFAKLSNVLGEKTQDSKTEVKSEWPKFSGDVKKFKSWYLLIVAQLSIPPWQELYDPETNSIVKSTLNSTLNSKLYAKLLVSLEGQALQDVVSRSHLRANGILLIINTSCGRGGRSGRTAYKMLRMNKYIQIQHIRQP